MNKLDILLQRVQKPSRYTGGELNSVTKQLQDVQIRFAFCFPDVYEVGMSHLGMKILYHMMNEREDTWCERVFAPWTDMEDEMRKEGVPLFALESKNNLTEFDFLGFTLQYELSYSNILNMLELSNIPLLSKDRTDGMPFICVGGPCAYNSEPLADFVDFVVLGEGEEVTMEYLDLYKEWKQSGGTRQEFLLKVSQIDGIYVPSFYDVEYNQDGTIKTYIPKNNAPSKVKKRIIKDLDTAYYPDKFIVPFMEIVHDRVMLELFRGCIRGCRFCQAGIIYRPVREKSVDVLSNQAKNLLESTGYEEMSLASLSTSDYTSLKELTDNLIAITEFNKANLSLPSLRVDSFSIDLMHKVQKVRKSGLTFAPEAGTQRMRDVINKGITEEDVLNSCSMAFEGGWSNVKLYFMIGLPFETEEDVVGIAGLAKRVEDAYYQIPKLQRKQRLNITVSVSSFVPKPFTPFQWEPQDSLETLREKQKLIGANIKSRNIKYNWHDSPVSRLEGVFSRGDRKLSAVLLEARKMGLRFDGWDEHFSYDKWVQCFENCGIDMNFYANRVRNTDEILPWDVVDVGVTKQFLIREKERSELCELTPNCRAKCSGCGIKGENCGE